MVHTQANGQDESTNKVILEGIKKKLEDAKDLWRNWCMKYYGQFTPPFIVLLRKLHSLWYVEHT